MSTTNNTSRSTCLRTPPRGTRFRRFVFTLNNYTAAEYNDVIAMPCNWMIVGRETGEGGTPHLQGACLLSQQMSLSAIKRTRGFSRAHIEQMRGSPADNKEYCSKEDPAPFEKGEMPKPGKRNDLNDIATRIIDGQSLRQLAEDVEGAVAIIKYHKGLTALRSMQTPTRTEPPTVLWLYGATGTGKTRSAVNFAERYPCPDGYWMSLDSGQWFDGYMGQRVVILDDYRTSFCKFSMLLRLLDRYTISVPIKGAYVPWVPSIIFITAPKKAADMWNLRTNEDLAQLQRRITREYEFSEEEPEPDFSEFLPVTYHLTDQGRQVIDLSRDNADPGGDTNGDAQMDASLSEELSDDLTPTQPLTSTPDSEDSDLEMLGSYESSDVDSPEFIARSRKRDFDFL